MKNCFLTGSNSGQSEVNYFLTDHFGSVRVIVDGSGEVKERNDYYPFGARNLRGDYLKNDNRLLYNGKEEQVTGIWDSRKLEKHDERPLRIGSIPVEDRYHRPFKDLTKTN